MARDEPSSQLVSEAPWIVRDKSGKPTSRADLVEDAQYVCDGQCADDAVEALVGECELYAKVNDAITSRRLTADQMAMLEWLLTDDGRNARMVVPESFDGVEAELIGFDYVGQSRELAARASAGFRGDMGERSEWTKRVWRWSKEVCDELKPPLVE